MFDIGMPELMVIFVVALLVLGLASCATLTRDSSIDQRYGPPDPTRYDKPAQPEGVPPR